MINAVVGGISTRGLWHVMNNSIVTVLSDSFLLK
jgi:hypothetical protein